MSTPTNFVTRSQWGSSFDYSGNTRMPSSPLGVALHWEGPKMGSFAHSECDNKVRQIEDFHVGGRGWAGIAYNALVCPHGYIYEGRGLRYRNAANGDPTKNGNYFAVCYLGGQGDPFTSLAKAAYIRAVQWFRADGNAGSKVIGHRDLTATACPGDEILAWLRTANFSAGVQEPAPTPTPEPVPLTAVWGKPETWKLGATGPDVTRLGERLTIHAKALGLPAPYSVGPGPEFTETDRTAVAAFQRAQGWTGDGADGYPGMLTFAKLDETPVTPTPAVKVTGLHWNIAGSDIHNGYKAENGTRGDDVARHALDIGFEVFVTCEAGQSDLRAGMNTVIGNLSPWMQRAKGIWHKPTFRKIAARKVYSAYGIFTYLSTMKWGAAIFGEKDGKKFAVLEIHTDYRSPAKQAGQVRSITAKFWADTDALGIPRQNTVICGDFNWDGSSGDNPFKALEGYGFVEKGNRTIATFMERKHLDGALAHKDADVTVTRQNRWDTRGVRLSDHNPIKFVITLK